MRIAAVVLAVLVLPSRANAQSSQGVRLEYRDTTCVPCQQFYEYANGGWIRSAQAPRADGQSGTIDELNVRRLAVLGRILDSLVASPARSGTPAWKLK